MSLRAFLQRIWNVLSGANDERTDEVIAKILRLTAEHNNLTTDLHGLFTMASVFDQRVTDLEVALGATSETQRDLGKKHDKLTRHTQNIAGTLHRLELNVGALQGESGDRQALVTALKLFEQKFLALKNVAAGAGGAAAGAPPRTASSETQPYDAVDRSQQERADGAVAAGAPADPPAPPAVQGADGSRKRRSREVDALEEGFQYHLKRMHRSPGN